jgi:hypothetical protein
LRQSEAIAFTSNQERATSNQQQATSKASWSEAEIALKAGQQVTSNKQPATRNE